MLTTWDSHDSEVSINGGTVVPLSHPCLDGFSLLHHSFRGTPMYGNPYLERW